MSDDERVEGESESEEGAEPEREDPGATAPGPRDDGGGTEPEDGEATGKREGPLSEVASEIDAGADEGASPGDQLFEAVEDVEDVDREALWRQVAGEDAAARVEEVRSEVEDESEGPTVKRPDSPGADGISVEDREERVVDKAKYCHSCEHFSPPPETRCTHSGTEILEMVDVDHFRVVNCPIVAEDEELENV